MTPYIDQSENFEPSTSTKFKWLRIRKAPVDFAIGTDSHFEMPGFFNVNVQYRRDSILFWCAVLLEFWGLGNILSAGKDSPIILIGVPIAFFLDVSAAIGAHWYAGKNCETKNKIFLSQCQNNTAATDGYKNELGGRRYVKLLWNSIIMIVCLLKITVFYGLNNGFDLLTFGISVSYIIVAIIHIFFTGHYIAEVHFRRNLHSEKKEYQKEATKSGKPHTEYSVQFSRENYEFSTAKELKQCKDGVHELLLIQKEEDKYKYAFKTWGMFVDDELFKIINQQKDEDKILVAFHGLRHQIQISNSAIHRIKSNEKKELISVEEEKKAIDNELAKFNI